MLAAFLEKRGVSTENAEALLAVEQAIAQNKLPSSENIISYNAYEAVSEFHDRFWIVNRTIEDYDNVVSQAFRIGAGILALSRVARRFTDHTGVGLLKDYAISVENGEHVDYDYTL